MLTRAQVAVLPNLAEVVYEPPSTDFVAKACNNCGLWSRDQYCLIHGDRRVFSFDNCAYHVLGEPRNKRVSLRIAPLEPKLSGLGFYPRGTRCGTCPSFVPDADGPMGDCNRVRDFKQLKYARVHAYGCCARYTGW